MHDRTSAYKAIILSAGQGGRLLPLTAKVPKCLLDLGGRSTLVWQLLALADAGVREAVVVTGFGTEQVELEISRRAPPQMRVRTLFNPFYALADNLASCWMARAEMSGPCLILNGDTLFESEVARRLLAAPPAPITVAIDRKSGYDGDDMKVATVGDRLAGIGKKLPPSQVTGESIGFLRFDAVGSERFVAEIERAMRAPKGPRLWFLSAIHRLARSGLEVRVASVEGLQWGELDFPADLVRNRAMAKAWAARETSADPRIAAGTRF
jgi:choline kinase